MSIPKFKEPIVYCDVDDTLVMWGYHTQPQPGYIEFEDPGSKGTYWLKPHQKHIDQLKAHKARGHTIIVWSAGGADWAETVVKTLGLSEYVDAVMSKPSWFYDDLPASEFMNEILRKYIKDE